MTGSAAERLWVWFEPDLLPGYAWSFPLPGGEVNVGFGVLRADGRRVADMKRTWPELLARPHVVEALGPGARLTGTHKAWPIPARIDRAVLGTGRALFVGDAAAATDPLTGEGIAQALESGILAAEAIVAAGAHRPGRGPGPLPRRRRRRAGARPPDVDGAAAGAAPRVGGAGGGAHRRAQPVDPAQLRPLAVRGRAPRRAGHARTGGTGSSSPAPAPTARRWTAAQDRRTARGSRGGHAATPGTDTVDPSTTGAADFPAVDAGRRTSLPWRCGDRV